MEPLCECSELKIKNIMLERQLGEEQELRRKFESFSHVYSYELKMALERLNAVEAKLKLIRNSFNFLRAGFAGFSTDLNMAIDSFGSN